MFIMLLGSCCLMHMSHSMATLEYMEIYFEGGLKDIGRCVTIARPRCREV